jgi:hypothetical protein
MYSTTLADSGGSGIAVDAAGNAYITGGGGPDFPTTNAFQPVLRNFGSAIIAKLTADGTALVYSTYLGGSGDSDHGWAIAVDAAGNAYVTGETQSMDFPAVNPFQPVYGGGSSNAFVAQLTADGSALVYSTYLGGSVGDQGNGIALDAAGNAYVTGYATSTDFPTVNPLQASLRGLQNAFVAKIRPD